MSPHTLHMHFHVGIPCVRPRDGTSIAGAEFGQHPRPDTETRSGCHCCVLDRPTTQWLKNNNTPFLGLRK